MDYTSLIVGVVASLCGIIFGYYGFKRNLKKDWQEDGSVRQDIKYIKDSLAEINKKLEKSDERYIEMVRKQAELELSCKQAHKRIDELIKGGKSNGNA